MKVVVVDDTAIARDGLGSALVEAGHDVRTASSHAEAEPLLVENPSVVVCDLYLSGPRSAPSLDTIAALAKRGPHVVVYSTWALDSDILATLAAGATTYLQKGPSLDPLLAVLESLPSDIGGDPVLTPEVARAMRRREEFGLTDAETDVLRHLSLHMTNKEIAEARFTSGETVKAQVASIRSKLQVGTRGAAVREARRMGLIGAWYTDEQ